MREITINNILMYEEIKSYKHILGCCVEVEVGIGNLVDNKFKFYEPQQYKSYTVVDIPTKISLMTGDIIGTEITDYTDLMQAGNNSITVNNLWNAIDTIRNRQQTT